MNCIYWNSNKSYCVLGCECCKECQFKKPLHLNTIENLAEIAGKNGKDKGFDHTQHVKETLKIIFEGVEVLNELIIDEDKTDKILIQIIKELRGFKRMFDNLRKNTYLIEKSEIKDFEKYGEEHADIIISSLANCELNGVDIEKSIVEKIKKNKSRPYKHNKKF